MALTTLEVLEQTLFSQGLARDASEFQRAVTSYFNTIGRSIRSTCSARRNSCRGSAGCAGKKPLAFFAERGRRHHLRAAQR